MKERKTSPIFETMPTAMHLSRRHFWHWVLVSLSMTQSPSKSHVYSIFFWIVRRKNPYYINTFLNKGINQLKYYVIVYLTTLTSNGSVMTSGGFVTADVATFPLHFYFGAVLPG